MKIHKEGYKIITNSFFILAIPVVVLYFLFPSGNIFWYALAAAILIFTLIVRFFRFPNITPAVNDSVVLAPADGKIVIVKEVYEGEFLRKECIQVSVFMNVFNVHINWFPVKGVVKYYKYHPGRYLVAMHPKSSEKNERTTIVVENERGTVLFRQIAGYLARRIVCYAEEGKFVRQGEQAGFIKFGSRVDLFLPLDSRVQVTKGQRVKGSRTIIATLPEQKKET
ncbi:MAG: phosphatidylserine decarboxylase family protein [Bacteroidales bacterium]